MQCSKHHYQEYFKLKHIAYKIHAHSSFRYLLLLLFMTLKPSVE